MTAQIAMPAYLSDLLSTVPSDNYFIHHIFDRMNEARHSAFREARRGKIRKFRDAFMAIPKEIILKGGDGVPYKSYNRHTLNDKDYEKYRQLFETVSREDAVKFYGVTPKEYDMWMAPWTTFYFYVSRSSSLLFELGSMDFPDEETARQQEGEYPDCEHSGNSDLWEQDYRPIFDSIDDDPNLCYKIEFIGTEDKLRRKHCPLI